MTNDQSNSTIKLRTSSSVVVFLCFVLLLSSPPIASACQLCALVMKVARYEQEARALEAQGKTASAKAKRAQANQYFARCARKFKDGSHTAALAAKAGWLSPPITSGGDLVDPTDPGVSGDPSGNGRSVAIGTSGNPGTNVTMNVGLLLHITPSNTCNYRIEVFPKTGTSLPSGVTIVNPIQTNTVTGSAAGTNIVVVPVTVGIASNVPPGTVVEFEHRVTKLETGGVLQSNTDLLRLYVPDTTSTNKLRWISSKVTTKVITIGNNSTGTASLEIKNQGGTSVDLRVEYGPAIDPASKSYQLDGSEADALDTFLGAQGGLGPQLPPETGVSSDVDTPPGAQSYAVSVPAGGSTTVSVSASTEDLCEYGMIGCCPFRLKLLNPAERPIDPLELIVIKQAAYLMNTTGSADDSDVEKIGFSGVAQTGGEIDLTVQGEVVNLLVEPGSTAFEVCDALAALVNEIPGRFTNDLFRVNAIFNYSRLDLTGNQPGDVSINFPFGPIPGLILFQEDSFQDLVVSNVVSTLNPGLGLYDVTADVVVTPGAQPPQQGIPVRCLANGAPLTHDLIIPPNALDPINPTLVPVQFLMPMYGPDNEVVVVVDPDGIHDEVSGNTSDNSANTSQPVITDLSITKLSLVAADVLVTGQPNAPVDLVIAPEITELNLVSVQPVNLNPGGMGNWAVDLTLEPQEFFRVKPRGQPLPDAQAQQGQLVPWEVFFQCDTACGSITNFTINPPAGPVSVVNQIPMGNFTIVQMQIDTTPIPLGIEVLQFQVVPQFSSLPPFPPGPQDVEVNLLVVP